MVSYLSVFDFDLQIHVVQLHYSKKGMKLNYLNLNAPPRPTNPNGIQLTMTAWIGTGNKKLGD